jgi:hypothetical protein
MYVRLFDVKVESHGLRGGFMFPEVVRPGTLSRALHMQLCIGNAVEILRLLQAGVVVDAREFEVLSGAAELFNSDDGTSETLMSSAILDSSGEMVAAVRAALAPDNVQDLQSTLHNLTEILAQIAEEKSIESVSTSIDDVVRKLSAIRHELAARATVSTDEAITPVSA